MTTGRILIAVGIIALLFLFIYIKYLSRNSGPDILFESTLKTINKATIGTKDELVCKPSANYVL